MGSAVGVILRTEVRAWRNRVARRGRARLILIALFLGAAALFIGGSVFSVSAAASHFLPASRDALLVGGFTTLSVLMLVVGFPTVIATLFVGRDLIQLVLAPVSSFSILLARGAIAAMANLLISGILLAGALGIGAGAGAPFVYYMLAVGLVIAQVAIVTGFQALLMSVVVRWAPARLVRDVAAAVAGLTGTAFYLVWNLSLRQSLQPSRQPDISSLTSLARRVDWLPSAWPGHALSAATEGQPASVAAWSFLVLVVAALLMAGAGALYRRTLLTGLGIFGGVQARWKSSPTVAAGGQRRAAGSPSRAIATKDWLGYRRDIRRLSRLLPATLFPIGYALAFVGPGRSGSGGLWTEVFIVSFVSMFMSTALATPSIPSERRGFQLLRMSPLSMWQLIRAKIVLTLVPVLVLSVVLSTTISLVGANGPAELIELAVLAVWMASGFVAIGVSAGAIDPHFDATDDRRAVGLAGSLAGLAAALAFGVLSVGAFALIRLATDSSVGRGLGSWATGADATWLAALGATALIAGAVLVVGLMLFAAHVRLRRFEASIATT